MGESKDTRRRAARGDDAPVEDGVDGEDHQMEDATEDSIDRLAFKTNFNLSRTIKPIYTGGVARIDPSSEARLYSTVGTDIHVMDLETGLEALTLKGEADDITCFAIKPNGKHLVAASRSLLIKCYDLQTGEAIRTWKAHEAPVLTMAFDATSTLVATGSADSTTKVWDVDRGHATHNLKGHSGVISALSFWNDLGGVKKKGKKDRRTSTGGSVRLATSSDDRKINLWDLNTKSIIVTLDSHASVVRGLAFSFDGRFLVSGGRDKILNLWDLQEQALVSTLPTHEGIEALGILDRSAVEGMDGLEADVDSGLFVYTGGESGVLKVWDMTSLTCVAQQEPEKNSKHEIMDCFHLKSRNALISITSDQNILFHDLTSTHLPRSHQIVGCNEEILDVCFLDPRDSTLAVASNSEQIRCYNLNGSGCEILCGHEETVVCLARSKDGRWLASGGKDRRCMIWHQGVKEKWPRAVGDCVGHTGAVGALAFSQKTHSFVLSGSEDRTIKCWDLTPLTGKEKTGVRLHTRFTFVAHDRDINAIVVAPNDKCFATGSQDKTAKVWSTVDGSLMGTCKGHRRGVWAVDFSPVDQVLATSSGDKTIKLWSVADFSCLKTFEGHLNSVLKLRFLSLGAQLVSSGSDGLVKLWTIKSGECAGTFDNHEDKVWALAVDRSERTVCSGGADGRISLWADCTKEDEDKRREEEDDRIAKEQELANCEYKKDYRRAVLLAMDLDQPFRLLSLLKNLRWDNPDPESRTGSNVVDKALLGFDDKKLEKLLRYIRDWNTNARHARTAQSILHLLLLRLHSSRLLRLPKIKELVDGMIPYSERHYGHAQDLLIASHVVGHTLDQMDNMITVDVDAADVDMGGEVGGRDVEDALGLLGLDEDDDE